MARQTLSAIDVNTDEAVLLLRLAGIEEFGSDVLALHRNVYNEEDQRTVDLMVMPNLLAQGMVDEEGRINRTIASWLFAIDAPDIQISMRVAAGEEMLRATVVRSDKMNVFALRHGHNIVFQQLWTDGSSVADTVAAPLWAALGEMEAAEFTSVTAAASEFAAIAQDFPAADGAIENAGKFQARLRALGADRPAIAVLGEAAVYSGRRTEIVISSSVDGITRRAPWGVGVLDTSRGRVISSTFRNGPATNTTFAPGDYSRFKTAIADLIALTPGKGWFSTA